MRYAGMRNPSFSTMKVTSRLFGFLVAFALAACARRDPTSASAPRTDNAAALNGARLELVEEGGFAALSTTHTVRHDERTFTYVRRQICNASCPAPMDSASGVLSVTASDSLFNIVWNAQPGTLKDDYGATPNSADMVTYTLRVIFGNATKTVRADDGTMPAPMRRIVEAIHGIVTTARK
jgi:hypothetical protein